MRVSTIFNINDITNGHIREVLGRQVREGTGDAAETGETGDTWDTEDTEDTGLTLMTVFRQGQRTQGRKERLERQGTPQCAYKGGARRSC